jgi:diguanylate cyclase (GGDEF)-like protein/PAS domain S-box-containing protein
MKLITELPLRRILPITIVLFALLMLALAFGLIKPYLGQLLHQNMEDSLRYTLNRLQGTTEYMLGRGDLEGVKREVAASSAHREVKYLLVTDPQGQVIASSRLAQVGRPLSSLGLHFAPELIAQATTSRQPIYQHQSAGENTLYGLMPYIYFDQNASLQDSWGLVLVELDLERSMAPLLHRLDRLFVWVALVVVLLATLAWVLIERAVSRRLLLITNTAAALAADELGQRTGLKGRDELSLIGQAIDKMAARLEQSRGQLLQANRQMENILRFIPSMVYIKDPKGFYRMVNERFIETLGKPDENGSTVFDLVPEPWAGEIAKRDREVMQTGKAMQLQTSFPVNGEMHNWFMVKFPLVGEDGMPYALCTVATDVTEQERNENLARIAQRIFEHTAEGIMITDAENRIVDVNQSLLDMTGYGREELLGQLPSVQKSEHQDAAFYARMWQDIQRNGKWSGELWNRRADKTVYPVRLSISTILNRKGELDGYFGIFQDITEEKNAERNLHHLAYHDTLTGLYNRTEFMRRVSEALRRGKRYDETFGLLFIDLDLFKEVNDSHGHAVGDQLLCQVAERLKGCLRESDSAFRLGGDEFTVLLPQPEGDDSLAAVANKLIDQLKTPLKVEGHAVRIGSSIGIVSYPRDGEDQDTLVGHADAAMYFAKEQGRGRYAFFDPQINARNQRNMRIKTGLNEALERDELYLVYQPKVLPGGAVCGYEALMRWHSHELGLVSPAEFIPIAEASQALESMTVWLLHQVGRDLQQTPLKGLQVAINLSPRQFQSGSWVDALREVLEEYHLGPEQFCIEVTESALVESFNTTVAQLSEVQALGVEVAIDDFGTGYSSLEYLKRLPIDYLKIDRSFVRDIGTDADDRIIVQTIILLAHSLGLKVVAEGVETAEQAEFLGQQACDELQGYLFAPPRRLEDLGDTAVKRQ